jgi:hypothetical protein
VTIAEIKRRVEASQPHFFSRKTLQFFGQRMSDFRVAKLESGLYRISAQRRLDGKPAGYTVRLFDPQTNQLSPEPIEAQS